ncbi:MAG: response regulator [Gammaproteobacteria bacterium]|nr:response regulator [Gammaproteobacteria bacterium]
MNTLLFVDDEKYNLNALTRIFADSGKELCTADSGEEALKQVSKYSPSLVILDVMMPGMDGIEVCSKIKARDENIMVLILSAKTALDDRIKGYSVRADDYLTKPYDPDELLAKAEILIRLYNAKKELADLNKNLEATVRKQTNELISRERQAIAGKMVKGIVHNLRGPLSVALASMQLGILKFDKLLLTPEIKSDGINTLVKQIKKNSSKVLEAIGKTNQLVDDMLIQGGTNPVEKLESIDLNRLIEKEYRFLKSEIVLRYKVEVEFHLNDTLPLISGRYSDFSQVFYNLVKNACEAMNNQKKKLLTISTKHKAAEIELSFSDTGPGIDPVRLPQIFDPFFSTKSEDNTTESGSGLGLFISSQLMAAYNAHITVENRIPAGLTFTLKIPLSNETKGDVI